jgi:2-methylcitrate dehydratase
MDRTTEILSEYACALRYEDLSSETVHQVKRTLVDTMGCAIGGFHAGPSEIARKLALSVTSTMPSRIIGTTKTSSPDLAGFANGVMVRYLDCNDSYFSPGGGHPSDMIPAVLAVADPLGTDGRTVITAIVLAYEVFCRLSDRVVASQHGWDQGIFGVIGAACGAGKVMGLSREAMGQAISLAVVPNLPMVVTRMGELSMWKGCATASATRAGVFAALLAQQGMTGPEAPFEGQGGLWAHTGGQQVKMERFGKGDEPFRIMNTLFKSFPSQIHTQGPISLALELRSQIAPPEIDAIRLRTYGIAVRTAATEPAKWAPQTREMADHSIPYLVAVAFLDGAVTPASFTKERLQDPAVHQLIAKMKVEEDPGFTDRFPEDYPCLLEVTAKAGRRLAAETSHPLGHRRNPLSDDQVVGKFFRLAGGALPEKRCRAAVDLLWSFEKSPNLRSLFDKLIL